MMRAIVAVSVAALLVGPAWAQPTIYDAGGFEGFMLGDMPGQDGWVEDTSGDYPPVQIINDPTGGGMGQVVEIDPPGVAGGWQGVARAYGPSTLSFVTIEWDQWREDLNDNFWYADDPSFSGWWTIQWDVNGQAHARGFDAGVPVTAGIWQHVTYTFDFITDTVTVDVDGTSNSITGINNTAAVGLAWEFEPGEFAGEGGPIYLDNLLVTQIPEPAVLCLLGMGLALLRRR